MDSEDDSKKRDFDEYGDEDSRVHLNKTALGNKQHQITMLEELAAQIRQEKDKFLYEKDLIEREKVRIRKEKEEEHIRMEKYVNMQRV